MPRPRALFRTAACAAALLIPVGATLVPAAAATPAAAAGCRLRDHVQGR